MDVDKYLLISNLLKFYSLQITTKAKSGHPTSSLSASDLMAVLYFEFFKYDFENPQNIYNDRLIFSKGHASPLFYSMLKVADQLSQEEILTYRSLYSPLQGHPTPQTPFTDFATGSLGMGLSFGLGMALALNKENLKNKIYVLLGDGEMAEGSVWEAIQYAAYQKLNNLVGIIDVNRLGETGQTMLGHDTASYAQRISSFGWNCIQIDGHNHNEIYNAYSNAQNQDMPCMVIAKTIKGKGVSFLEDKEGKHGKVLTEEEFEKAKQELNVTELDKETVFSISKPDEIKLIESDSFNYSNINISSLLKNYTSSHDQIATRKAYGETLSELAKSSNNICVLDGDLSDSTFSGLVQKENPSQFLNMFIAEQNMIAVATGISKMGKTVFASTFSAFLTRALDQIRMSSLSESQIKICGSHAGVSIGEDGPSQMGLEDIAMMNSVFDSTVLYPSDAVSTAKLVVQIPSIKNIVYIRTTRKPTNVIYSENETFPIGGSKILKSSENDVCLIVAAGITVHEALKAHELLQKENINIKIIDCYSIKPIDSETLIKSASLSNNKIVVIEDHYAQGGLGDSVLNVFAQQANTQIYKMSITIRPHSGKSEELLEYHNISYIDIIDKIKSFPDTISNS
ncbi:MAG: transketolase [bacterium]|nr:transketolase [bacterium]